MLFLNLYSDVELDGSHVVALAVPDAADCLVLHLRSMLFDQQAAAYKDLQVHINHIEFLGFVSVIALLSAMTELQSQFRLAQ